MVLWLDPALTKINTRTPEAILRLLPKNTMAIEFIRPTTNAVAAAEFIS
jgi:hypothetical protein